MSTSKTSRPCHIVPGHSFSGAAYRDTLVFPREAVGYPLTLRVIVTTRYGAVDLNWALTTRA